MSVRHTPLCPPQIENLLDNCYTPKFVHIILLLLLHKNRNVRSKGILPLVKSCIPTYIRPHIWRYLCSRNRTKLYCNVLDLAVDSFPFQWEYYLYMLLKMSVINYIPLLSLFLYWARFLQMNGCSAVMLFHQNLWVSFVIYFCCQPFCQ